jgi:2Fe-2S ferredoxin
MTTIHYILKDGSTRSIEARPGASVMETAVHHDVRGIDAECGGSCSCATCHVYVDDAFVDRLAPPDEMESELLQGAAAERRANSRLSCQIVVTPALEGLTVRIPARQA